MYLVKIKTKFNTISLEVDDYNAPEVQEILEQPYIEEVKIENLKDALIEEREKALHHLVGTNYWNGKVKELTKRIKEV